MLSEKIKLVIGILEQCSTDYTWYKAQLEAEQNKENTIRHELEGVGITHRKPPGYKDRAKLATDYQNVLITRRLAKDKVLLNEPVASFLDSDIGIKAVNQLKRVLGEVRKVESKMVDREFMPRYTENSAPTNHELEKSLEKMIREWKKKK